MSMFDTYRFTQIFIVCGACVIFQFRSLMIKSIFIGLLAIPVLSPGLALGQAHGLGVERDTNETIRRLAERLDQAEVELRYFRQRDSELQRLEAAVQRLPAIETSLQTISTSQRSKLAWDKLLSDPPRTAGTGNVCNCCGVWRNCHCPCQGGGLRFDYHGYYLILRGKGAADMLFADSPTAPSAFTLFALPKPTPDREVHEISGRRSSLGFAFGFPQWGSFDVEANVLFDFQGAVPGSDTAGVYFALGNVRLANDQWRFIVGRDFHLTGPVNPVALNWSNLQQGGAIGSPGQKEQFRVDRFIHWSDQAKTTLQIAATNPNSNFVLDEQQRLISEDDGGPNYEGRVALTLGTAGSRYAEIGVGGVTGRLRVVDQTIPANFSGEIWLTVLDFAVHGDRAGVHGELWTGSGIGDYDAAIGQTASPVLGEFIDASGGWIQVWYRWTDCLASYVGWGIDDPRDANLDPGFRARNEVIMGNVLWQATDNLQIGYELRYYETDYIAPSVSNDSLVHQIAVEVSLF